MPTIHLKPQKATKEIMQDLENKQLIQRLTSKNAYIANTPQGETLGKNLYKTSAAYGTHKLISVSVNRTEIKSGIGYHPDKEDFFLISTPQNSRPLFLIISYLGKEQLEKKIQEKALSQADFILLEMPYCHPEISFFTMNPGVPHGEATLAGQGECPIFYVTEPSEMPLFYFDFIDYTIVIEDAS